MNLTTSAYLLVFEALPEDASAIHSARLAYQSTPLIYPAICVCRVFVRSELTCIGKWFKCIQIQIVSVLSKQRLV